MRPFKCRKTTLTFVAVILVLLLLEACGPILSIHPFYEDKDVVFDPALLGTWVDPTDADSAPLVFERGKGDSYKAIMRSDDNSDVDAVFEVHLLKLGGRVFLDAVQMKNRIAGKEVDIGLAVPAHILGQVSIEGNVLHLSLLDQEWVEKELKAGKISIPHEEADGDVVLTASTADLQKFVLDHANDENAFSALGPLQRKK
ncbi:MAG TPA: hypothetical protein VLY23_08860 [Candidatus Acidoferrum sp.]|nr:hypothetical protein [Candidatus Acidoferrum sp.]